MSRRETRRRGGREAAPHGRPSSLPPQSSSGCRHERRHLRDLYAALGIFAVAIVVRLVHLGQMHATPFFSMLMGDARGYDAWARQIAGGDWIGSDVFYQAPLYPYFIGSVYSVFGGDLMALRLVQALVGSLSCVLLWYAGRRWFSPRAGLLAGAMLACYAPAIFFDGLVQKSVLGVFFVCVVLALLGYVIERGGSEDPPLQARPGQEAGEWGQGGADDLSLRERGSAPWIALGVALGCLSLTRENALLLIPLIVAWVILEGRGAVENVRRSRLRRVGLVALGLAATLGPVAARNYAVGGGLHVTTSQFGPNFYIGNNAEADGTYQSLRFGRGSPEYERLDATTLAERALGRTLTPGEVSDYWTDRATSFIVSHPAAWLRLQARKAMLLLNATEMVDSESQEAHAEYSSPLAVLTPVAHFGVLLPLAVFGVALTWPDRRRLWILYAVALTYAASTVLFFVAARYRYPLVPIAVLFAAAGLARAIAASVSSLSEWLVQHRVAVGAALGVALVSNWPMLSVDRMRAITETNLGTALYEHGRLPEAVARFHKAIAVQADYVPAYNNLGAALRAQGHTDEAITTYERGLRLHSDYPELHFNLANALMEQNRPAEAAEHLRLASAASPNSVDVHNNLGKALFEQGQSVAAARELEAALALDPESVQAHRNLGNVLASLDRFEEARAHLERAIALAPENADAHYDLGSLWLERGGFEQAAAHFRAAVDIEPAYVEALNNLGIALASQGRLDAAVAQWEAALKIRPDFADARRNLETARRAR